MSASLGIRRGLETRSSLGVGVYSPFPSDFPVLVQDLSLCGETFPLGREGPPPETETPG